MVQNFFHACSNVCTPHFGMDEPPPVAVVGLEQTTYQVDEGTCEVEVCVEVKTTSLDCTITFPISVTFTTVDGTGMLLYTSLDVILHHLIMFLLC